MRNIFVIFLFLFSGSLFADLNITPAKSALVVIDMQPYFISRYGFDKDFENQKKVNAVITEQIKVIEEAKKKHIPIVIIEYAIIGEFNNLGVTDHRLMEAIEGYEKYEVVKKSTDDAFSMQNYWKMDLSFFLNIHSVNHLVITGANGSQCVMDTIRGALDSGYNVTAYSKGIADFQSEEFVYPYNKFDKPWYNLKCSYCKQNQITQFEELSTWMNQ